jgi:hypothetical protein
MNLLRSLLAVLFAIAIANPACCCTLRSHDEPAKVSHCCGGPKEEKHSPDACACVAKSPQKAEEPPALPVFKAIELPTVLPPAVMVALPPIPVRELPRPDFFHGTGPPRLRLVMFQRFLI